MNETAVRDLMAGLADEVPTTTSVSSHRAVETAARQRRQQHRWVVSGAAAVVALVLVLTAVAVNATIVQTAHLTWIQVPQ